MEEYNITAITAEIVEAFVANNSVASADLPKIILEVHAALQGIDKPDTKREQVEVKLVPAVAIKKSVTPGFVVCLEDGKKFKSLKRHLMAQHGMTPAEYRAKWDLPSDYPMSAPSYAAHRSQIAKAMGLGQSRGRAGRKKVRT